MQPRFPGGENRTQVPVFRLLQSHNTLRTVQIGKPFLHITPSFQAYKKSGRQDTNSEYKTVKNNYSKRNHGSASFLISFRNCQVVCSENDTRRLVELMHNPQLEFYTVRGLKKYLLPKLNLL